MLCTASDTFRILSYSALFFLHICQHIQSNLALLRPIHTYRNIIKAYSVLFYSVLKYKILQLDPLPDTNPSSAQETDIFVKPNNQITA